MHINTSDFLIGEPVYSSKSFVLFFQLPVISLSIADTNQALWYFSFLIVFFNEAALLTWSRINVTGSEQSENLNFKIAQIHFVNNTFCSILQLFGEFLDEAIKLIACHHEQK